MLELLSREDDDSQREADTIDSYLLFQHSGSAGMYGNEAKTTDKSALSHSTHSDSVFLFCENHHREHTITNQAKINAHKYVIRERQSPQIKD